METPEPDDWLSTLVSWVRVTPNLLHDLAKRQPVYVILLLSFLPVVAALVHGVSWFAEVGIIICYLAFLSCVAVLAAFNIRNAQRAERRAMKSLKAEKQRRGASAERAKGRRPRQQNLLD